MAIKWSSALCTWNLVIESVEKNNVILLNISYLTYNTRSFGNQNKPVRFSDNKLTKKDVQFFSKQNQQ